MFVAGLCLVLGIGVVGAARSVAGPAVGAPGEPSAGDVAASLLLTAGIPLLWLGKTRVQPLTGALDYLRLRNLARATPFGLAAAAVMLAIGAVAPGAAAVGTAPPWGVLVAYGIVAPFGEEILFRGVLQPRFGIAAQAIAFGLVHVAATGLAGACVVAVLGAVLGFAAQRWGLWASAVAHGAYNVVALATG